MAKKRLTQNPTLLTALLSVATLAGYATYRLTVGGSDAEMAADHSDHDDSMQAPADDSAASRFADSLPDIVLNDLAGTPTPLSTWVGQPMLINFWATWCAPCLREIPLLKAFNDEHPAIQVVGIAVDRDEPVREFAAEMAFNYPNLVGQTEAMNAAAALGVEVIALPFTVFTDAEGAILGIHSGEIHREHLENLAATLADLEAGRIGRDTARERIAGLM